MFSGTQSYAGNHGKKTTGAGRETLLPRIERQKAKVQQHGVRRDFEAEVREVKPSNETHAADVTSGDATKHRVLKLKN